MTVAVLVFNTNPLNSWALVDRTNAPGKRSVTFQLQIQPSQQDDGNVPASGMSSVSCWCQNYHDEALKCCRCLVLELWSPWEIFFLKISSLVMLTGNWRPTCTDLKYGGDRWMDGWRGGIEGGGWMDVERNREMNAERNGRLYLWKDGWIEGWMNGGRYRGRKGWI